MAIAAREGRLIVAFLSTRYRNGAGLRLTTIW
jgi:hypothetical protein